jgi:hypothetical protein
MTPIFKANSTKKTAHSGASAAFIGLTLQTSQSVVIKNGLKSVVRHCKYRIWYSESFDKKLIYQFDFGKLLIRSLRLSEFSSSEAPQENFRHYD